MELDAAAMAMMQCRCRPKGERRAWQRYGQRDERPTRLFGFVPRHNIEVPTLQRPDDEPSRIAFLPSALLYTTELLRDDMLS
jgi:hypothetical protein